jgi:uncharacterized HAD superfamily protein
VRIGIDLDGVCYDFVNALHAFAETHLGRELPRNFHVWGFFEEWGIDWDGFLALMEAGCSAGLLYHKGDLAPGAAETLQPLHEAGHEIVFVTARGEYAQRATRDWLDGHGLYHDLIVGADDTAAHRLDILLDDGAHNIERARAEGIFAVIFDQPWNQDAVGPRVYGWDGFRALMHLVDAGPFTLAELVEGAA